MVKLRVPHNNYSARERIWERDRETERLSTFIYWFSLEESNILLKMLWTVCAICYFVCLSLWAGLITEITLLRIINQKSILFGKRDVHKPGLIWVIWDKSVIRSSIQRQSGEGTQENDGKGCTYAICGQNTSFFYAKS